MIVRYTRPRMGRIWEDQNKYQRWLDVELAVVETLAEDGTIPKKDADEIKNRASFSVDRINEIEAEVKHDVIAFTTSVAGFVGPSSRFFHFGLTSSDVLDTAMALQVRDASEIINKGLTRLRSEEHTSELQSHVNLVCRLLLEKKKTKDMLINSINDYDQDLFIDPKSLYNVTFDCYPHTPTIHCSTPPN